MQDEFENEIQAKGLTAPRVTPADLEAAIASEHYFRASDGVIGASALAGGTEAPCPQALALLTFCVIVMQNGFTVVGKSACASPENFDAELGRKIARQDAVSQLWPLLGYSLKEELHRKANSFGAQLFNAAKAQTEAREAQPANITDTDRLNFIIADGQYPMNSTFLGQPGANGETALFPGADAVRANLDKAITKAKSA